MKKAIYKRTIFWQMFRNSLSLLSGPIMFSLHEFKATDTTMLVAGIIGFIAALVSIWFVDNDNNGVVDLFEWGDESK